MTRSHRRPLVRRATDWLVEQLPIRVIRLFWVALWHRDTVLVSALTGWLPYRLRPIKLLLRLRAIKKIYPQASISAMAIISDSDWTELPQRRSTSTGPRTRRKSVD